jgi:hypothetical protein
MNRNGRLICYECDARNNGKAETEKHHPCGRANDPSFTVAIPTNDHRVLSVDRQVDWPDDTLRNPGASPLRKASASIRSWLDVLWLLIEHAIGWIPNFLEWLDDQLVERIGSTWATDWGWEQS